MTMTCDSLSKSGKALHSQAIKVRSHFVKECCYIYPPPNISYRVCKQSVSRMITNQIFSLISGFHIELKHLYYLDDMIRTGHINGRPRRGLLIVAKIQISGYGLIWFMTWIRRKKCSDCAKNAAYEIWHKRKNSDNTWWSLIRLLQDPSGRQVKWIFATYGRSRRAQGEK